MKRFYFLSILMLVLVSAAFAGNAPRIVQCGLDPVTVHPGEQFTLFADVSDADGLADVNMVGLLAEDDLLMMVPKSDSVSGRFEVSYTMPEGAPSGTYTLSMAAADLDSNVSSINYFTFKIATEPNVVQLVSPENDAVIDCHGLTVFEWQPYSDDVKGYEFALNLVEGIQVTAQVPANVTSLPIPGELWRLMSDGEYFWQVGAITEVGSEPIAWSELRSFTTDCNNPWPGEVFGVVTEKDDTNQALRVRSNWNEGPNGTWVSVTENTMIWNAEGMEITYADIVVGDSIFAIGQYVNERFVADEIFVEGTQPPTPTDEVFGHVTAVDIDNLTLTVFCHRTEMETLIQVTDETEMFNEYGPITLADVQVNDFANAFGSIQGDVFVADELFVMNHQGPGHGDHYFGQIAAIDEVNQTFDLQFDDFGVMETITVVVTVDTVLHNSSGQITFSDLEVDQIADVSGLWEADAFIANHVTVHDNHQPPQPGEHIMGTITRIDAATMQFTINPDHWENGTITVQVTSETMIEGMMGPLSFDDLEVDQWVMIEGEYTGDLFTAVFIMVHDDHQPPQPGEHIMGTITSIDAAAMQITVNPDHWENGMITVQVTSETMIEGMMGPLSFNDLEVDQMVMIEGEYTGDLFTAVFIMVHDDHQPPQPGEHIMGTITSIDAAAMQITVNPDHWENGMITVQVTSETMIEGMMGPLSFDDLEVDQWVMIEGEYTGDLFTAVFIMVHDDHQPPQPGEHIMGTITSVDAATMQFTINPDHWENGTITVQVTSDTMIEGMMGPLSFDDLEVDQMVMIEGEYTGDLFTAVFIMVHDDHQPPQPGAEAAGTIDQIDYNAMTFDLVLDGHPQRTITVQATAETVIHNSQGPLSFSDLQNEDFAIVFFEHAGGTLLAQEILLPE